MPIYQYDCAGCQRRVDIFFRSISSVGKPTCPECGSAKLKRAVSMVARRRTRSERIESIDINQELGRVDGMDAGSFAHWAKRLGREYDDELGSNFTELAERAYAGDDPTERVDPAHTLRYQVDRALHEPQSTGDAESGVDSF